MATPRKPRKQKPKVEDPDRPLTELELRDDEIVAAKLRGLSDEQVARTYGLTPRRIRQILKAWRDSSPGLRQRGASDPILIVDELLEQYQGAAEELALIAATSKNESARIGAIGRRLDALKAQTELLQAIGILPKDLGQLRVAIDSRHVALNIYRVLDAEGIPESVQDRIVAVLESGALEPAAQN